MSIGVEFNCDMLSSEIDDIPNSSVRDANIREIISILIGESKVTSHNRQLTNLQCAGLLAKMLRILVNVITDSGLR